MKSYFICWHFFFFVLRLYQPKNFIDNNFHPSSPSSSLRAHVVIIVLSLSHRRRWLRCVTGVWRQRRGFTLRRSGNICPRTRPLFIFCEPRHGFAEPAAPVWRPRVVLRGSKRDHDAVRLDTQTLASEDQRSRSTHVHTLTHARTRQLISL